MKINIGSANISKDFFGEAQKFMNLLKENGYELIKNAKSDKYSYSFDITIEEERTPKKDGHND